jgi:hypothetical protein
MYILICLGIQGLYPAEISCRFWRDFVSVGTIRLVGSSFSFADGKDRRTRCTMRAVSGTLLLLLLLCVVCGKSPKACNSCCKSECVCSDPRYKPHHSIKRACVEKGMYRKIP